MKVVYIAGPYRAPTEYQVWANIMEAREAALFVWEHGGIALCPHLNTMLFGGAMPDETWLIGDLELLARCDALLGTNRLDESSGAMSEYLEAERLNKPRYPWVRRDDLAVWLKERP